MKSQFNQKLIKHLQHLLHIDPERVKYLLLEIDYHHLLKQPEVKVLFDGTELTVQHIESRTAAYQKLRISWNKSKAVKELKADLKELEATSSQLSTTNLIPSPLPDFKDESMNFPFAQSTNTFSIGTTIETPSRQSIKTKRNHLKSTPIRSIKSTPNKSIKSTPKSPSSLARMELLKAKRSSMGYTSMQEQHEEDSFDSSDEEQETEADVLVKTKSFGSFLNSIHHGCESIYDDNFNGQKGEETVLAHAQCLKLKDPGGAMTQFLSTAKENAR